MTDEAAAIVPVDLPVARRGARFTRRLSRSHTRHTWADPVVGAVTLALAVAVLVAIWLLVRPLALLLAAIVIGEALSPLIDWLARWIPRGVAIALIFLVILLVALGLSWIVLPAMIAQAEEIVTNVPDFLNATRHGIERLGVVSSVRLENTVQSNLYRFGDAVFTLPITVAASAFEILAVIFLAVYWSVGKPALRGFILSLFPAQRREGVGNILAEMGRSMGGYLRGTLINALVIGVCDYIGLLVIGVRYPLVLALISAASEPIPVVGPFIGAVPALAVALLDSPRQALIVIVFKVALQQFEGQLLTPNIMRKQTDVPQLLVLFALLAGASVGGLLGALIAIPLAGALKVLVVRIVAPALRQQLAASLTAASPDHGADDAASGG